MVGSWLVPAIAYMLAVGALGVTSKLALRHVTWPATVLSATIFYAVICVALLLRGDLRLPSGAGPWSLVLVSGLLTAGAFPLLLIALRNGAATQVVPVTASYPVITAILSAFVLAEGFSAQRLIGTLLVVIGATLVATRL